MTLKTTIGGRTVEEPKTLDVPGKGIREIAFPVTLSRPQQASDAAAEAQVEFELIVQSGGERDVVHSGGAAAALRHAGLRRGQRFGQPRHDRLGRAAQGHVVEGARLADPRRPDGRAKPVGHRVGAAPPCQIEVGRIASGLESATSDLMAVAGPEKLLRQPRRRRPRGPGPRRPHPRGGQPALARQSDDGGWSWTGCGGGSDRYATSRIVWALGLARQAGYHVPDGQFQQGRRRELHNRGGDRRRRLRDQGDPVARPGRWRTRAISPWPIGSIASGSGSPPPRWPIWPWPWRPWTARPTADELLDLLATRGLDEPPRARGCRRGRLAAWSHSPAEICGHSRRWRPGGYAQVAEGQGAGRLAAGPSRRPPLVAGQGDRPGRAGPVPLVRREPLPGEQYTLAVFVNDVQVKTLDVDPARRHAVDRRAPRRCSSRAAGSGSNSRSPAAGATPTSASWADSCRPTSCAARPRLAGHADLRAGAAGDGRPRRCRAASASCRAGYATFQQSAGRNCRSAARGLVELATSGGRTCAACDAPEERLEYLVVTEPIPSGAAVIEQLGPRRLRAVRNRPGAITFYMGNRRYVEPIRYEMYGYLPGKYRAGPTVVRNAYRPEQWLVAARKRAGRAARGSGKQPIPTASRPRNSATGQARICQEGLRKARRAPGRVAGRSGTCGAEVYQETVRMLLDVHLELGPPAKIVHYFEIVKEKWPDEEMPFAKIMKVGAAYHAIGEYERSYLVFLRDGREQLRPRQRRGRFPRDAGQFARSVEVDGPAAREYPPERYTAEADLRPGPAGLCQGPEAAADAKLPASRRSTASTWCAGRGRCWRAS